MARFKNDNILLNVHQRIDFLDDDGSVAASQYFDGDQFVFEGITISGAQGPPGPAGTGVPGNYIGDEDGNSRVTVNTTDEIVLRTVGVDHAILTDGGNLLLGDNNSNNVGGKLNITHTGNNALVLDRFSDSDGASGLWFKKARGVRTEVGATHALIGDTTGDISFYAYGESAGGIDTFLKSAEIRSIVDGTPGEDSMPGRIEFVTTGTDWDSAAVGLTVTQNAGIKLNSGEEVDTIRDDLTDNSQDNELVTALGIWTAFEALSADVEEQLTTISGLDLSMSRIFDPVYSGTEVKIEDDKIFFTNQGDEVANFDTLGYFNFGGHKINTIYNGDLAEEADTYAVPTASAVKSYIDNYIGGAGGWEEKLVSDGGLSDLELSDLSWSATLAGQPAFDFFQITLNGGSMHGKKTRHLFFGDKAEDMPSFTNFNRPAMAVHSVHGSRLYLYNKKNYGDDTLPYQQTPGISIVQDEASDGNSRGNLSFGNGSIEMFQGNQETWPELPRSEHEMHIKLGTYDVYNGEVSEGGPYYGGILKLFCKLRFMNGYAWGHENESNWINPLQDDDGWGHYGNNVWVNRVAGCHYTKTRDEVGSKFDAPPESFIGTGNDDHCLVTGKYVHTAIDVATAAWEEKTTADRIASGTEGYDEVNHSVAVSRTGVSLSYGWQYEFDNQLLLYTPWYGNHNNGDKVKVGARFISKRGDVGNKVIIESVATGASDPVLDRVLGFPATAPTLQFFRKRGASHIKSGDILGQLSWVGQAQNSGVNSNPCDNYTAYTAAAAIRVISSQEATSSKVPVDMGFYVGGAHGGGPNTDIYNLFTLRGVSQTIHLGNWTSPSFLRYNDNTGVAKGTPGRVHLDDLTFSKNQLSGNLTMTARTTGWGNMNSSIMFAGSTKGTNGSSGLAVSDNTGAYISSVGGWKRAPFARIDGGPAGDWLNSAENAGQLSLMIHRENSLTFDEIIRVNGVGRVVIGEDDAGKGCDVTAPSKLTVAQPLNTYVGGLSLINTDGNGSYIFTGADDELVLNSAQTGVRVIALNTGNGKVHVGGTTSNTADYIMRLNGHVIPAINNAYNLGSSIYKWNDVWATNGTIQTSDLTQKENVSQAEFGLEFVKGMRPITFTRKGGNRRHYGFGAQDLEKLVKAFGKRVKDNAFIVKDEDGNYGLRYEEIIPILAKAIQELAEKVEG